MFKNILQCLEKTSKKYADKKSFCSIDKEITYNELLTSSKKIGTKIAEIVCCTNNPIVIFIDKSTNCIETMLGILYSGNFYTVLDVNSPKERLASILNTLNPIMVITDNKNKLKAENLQIFNKLYLYEDLLINTFNKNLLDTIQNNIIDTDPMYILFTSGSTGIPKGTVVSHRSVISYISSIEKTFKIDSNTIFGSQAPFYFSMSVLDIYSTILVGATFYIIPKMYFSFPIKLIEFLKGNHINTLYWVPSALSIISNLNALENVCLDELKLILFAGEVMPAKQLNYWINHVPTAKYANLYGPTEITDICTYYIINKPFKDTDQIPIGTHCDNCNILILKSDGTKALPNEKGELCVRGSFLSMGYYNNPVKTKEVFVQNPLNSHYPEIIYKTGDIVKENDNGEIIYLSRKDFQIKKNGYRIELGEIEHIVNTVDNISTCACIYKQAKEEIILFYESPVLSEKDLANILKKKLLTYMYPNRIIKLNKFPYNSNGKIDKKFLERSVN
jgi:D-alanine--poly(phosphoribitol) ligase subunit 1